VFQITYGSLGGSFHPRNPPREVSVKPNGPNLKGSGWNGAKIRGSIVTFEVPGSRHHHLMPRTSEQLVRFWPAFDSTDPAGRGQADFCIIMSKVGVERVDL
jgi:hypothetical protein